MPMLDELMKSPEEMAKEEKAKKQKKINDFLGKLMSGSDDTAESKPKKGKGKKSPSGKSKGIRSEKDLLELLPR